MKTRAQMIDAIVTLDSRLSGPSPDANVLQHGKFARLTDWQLRQMYESCMRVRARGADLRSAVEKLKERK